MAAPSKTDEIRQATVAKVDEQAGGPSGAGQQAPGGAIAVPRVHVPDTLTGLTQADLEQLLAPATVQPGVWLRHLLTMDEYPEEEEADTGLGLLAAILMADSPDAVLHALDLQRAKAMCGGEPGGHSPLLVITGARGMKSSFEEGSPIYAIVSAVVKATGERIQFTTGARAVQVTILKMMAEGWMPFEALLQIRSQPTQRGFYPLSLVAGG